MPFVFIRNNIFWVGNVLERRALFLFLFFLKKKMGISVFLLLFSKKKKKFLHVLN